MIAGRYLRIKTFNDPSKHKQPRPGPSKKPTLESIKASIEKKKRRGRE